MRMHHIRVGLVLKKLSWGISSCQELKDSKVQEFLTLKHDFLSVHEYALISPNCPIMLLKLLRI